MCSDIEVCGNSCEHRARLGALAGIALGCAAAWQVAARVLDAVGPVVRDVAVVVVVAVAGVIGAALVLAVLRVRRRRAVLSARVVRAAAVPAVVIPAAGVPLALVVGAAVWTGALQVAAAWVLGGFVWARVREIRGMRAPGAYEALPRPARAPVRPLPPGAPVRAGVARVTVLSRHDERGAR